MGNLILLGRKTSTSSFSLGSLRSTHSPNMSEEKKEVDYSLNNPDTLTKYRTAATISEKVLAEVSKLCVPGAKFVEVCQKGDKILEEEIDKVYRGKKVIKGFSHPTTVSPSSFITPYTPLTPTRPKLLVKSRMARLSRSSLVLKLTVSVPSSATPSLLANPARSRAARPTWHLPPTTLTSFCCV